MPRLLPVGNGGVTNTNTHNIALSQLYQRSEMRREGHPCFALLLISLSCFRLSNGKRQAFVSRHYLMKSEVLKEDLNGCF